MSASFSLIMVHAINGIISRIVDSCTQLQKLPVKYQRYRCAIDFEQCFVTTYAHSGWLQIRSLGSVYAYWKHEPWEFILRLDLEGPSGSVRSELYNATRVWFSIRLNASHLSDTVWSSRIAQCRWKALLFLPTTNLQRWFGNPRSRATRILNPFQTFSIRIENRWSIYLDPSLQHTTNVLNQSIHLITRSTFTSTTCRTLKKNWNLRESCMNG